MTGRLAAGGPTRAQRRLAFLGAALLIVLHLDFLLGDFLLGDFLLGGALWPGPEDVLLLGWIPPELAYRLAWMGLAWIYLEWFTRRGWGSER